MIESNAGGSRQRDAPSCQNTRQLVFWLAYSSASLQLREHLKAQLTPLSAEQAAPLFVQLNQAHIRTPHSTPQQPCGRVQDWSYRLARCSLQALAMKRATTR